MIGSFLDVVQLWRSLSYGASVTKQAVQSSPRYLEAHGMIKCAYEARRQTRVCVIKPTPTAYALSRGWSDGSSRAPRRQ